MPVCREAIAVKATQSIICAKPHETPAVLEDAIYRTVGEPVLDGIYEQLPGGEEKVFLGSVVSRLPAEVEAKIGR